MRLMSGLDKPASPDAVAASSPGLARRAGEVAAFALLIAAAAQVRVPVPGTPVPMTLQLLAVLAVGLWLPWRNALAVVGLYLGLGAAGLPVWAPGSTGLFGPTGGYLLGFVPAVLICSLMTGVSAGRWRRLVAAMVGATCVLAVGAFGLAVWSGSAWRDAILLGVAPFAAKALVEAIAAALLSEALPWRRWRQCGLGGNAGRELN